MVNYLNAPVVKPSTVFALAMSITRSARRSFGLMVFNWRESLIAKWCTNSPLSSESEDGNMDREKLKLPGSSPAQCKVTG